MPAGSSVFDCCCGCGGNAIAFARRCAVTAIDVSSDRVALARRNAKIYGVDVRVDVGDALRDERTADVLFVDAPWGREWDKERTDLDSLPLLRDVLAAAPGGGGARVDLHHPGGGGGWGAPALCDRGLCRGGACSGCGGDRRWWHQVQR